MAVMTYIDAINTALHEEIERDPNVSVIGEDVAKMGGALKATKGFLEKFGNERVIDSPLAEGAIISSSVGAAMAGMRPVPEIQFVDFITPGIDAITNKLRSCAIAAQALSLAPSRFASATAGA